MKSLYKRREKSLESFSEAMSGPTPMSPSTSPAGVVSSSGDEWQTSIFVRQRRLTQDDVEESKHTNSRNIPDDQRLQEPGCFYCQDRPENHAFLGFSSQNHPWHRAPCDIWPSEAIGCE